MSHGILIDLNPSLFALLVTSGMVTAGFVLGTGVGNILARFERVAGRRSRVR